MHVVGCLGDHSPRARAIAKAVTQMARAIPGGCEADDVDRAVARRRFFQALRYWRPAVAPGGAKANSTRIRAPPTISEETASRLHLVERGKKNVRVSRTSCVEWSYAMGLGVFGVRAPPKTSPGAKITQDRSRGKTQHPSLASVVYFSNACLLEYGRRPRSAQTHPRVYPTGSARTPRRS